MAEQDIYYKVVQLENGNKTQHFIKISFFPPPDRISVRVHLIFGPGRKNNEIIMTVMISVTNA